MESQFILALFQHGYKAKTSTLFHLLKGKHTSSVLIYGFLFNSLRFFGAFPELSETDYNYCLNELKEKEYLIFFNDGQGQLSKKGANYLLSNSINFLSEYSWIDFFRFGKSDDECWRMLQFSIQIISYLSYGENKYAPLEQSPIFQNHIKKIIKKYPKVRLVQQSKTEWQFLLSKFTIEEANFFAHQFTGYQQTGQIIQQLVDPNKTSLTNYLLWKSRLHKLLTYILSNEQTSILKQLIHPLIKKNENKSMNETVEYIKLNTPLEEIAQKRKIKISTVKDHCLEAAIMGVLDIDQFVNQSSFTTFDKIQGAFQEWQYRELKEKIVSLDYIDFRLYQIKKKHLE